MNEQGDGRTSCATTQLAFGDKSLKLEGLGLWGHIFKMLTHVARPPARKIMPIYSLAVVPYGPKAAQPLMSLPVVPGVQDSPGVQSQLPPSERVP